MFCLVQRLICLHHYLCRSLFVIDWCDIGGQGSKCIWLYLKISISLKYCFSQYCLPTRSQQISHKVGTGETWKFLHSALSFSPCFITWKVLFLAHYEAKWLIMALFSFHSFWMCKMICLDFIFVFKSSLLTQLIGLR